MCLAIPGKVIDRTDKIVQVSYPGNVVQKAMIADLQVFVDDMVMVQMGIVIKKLTNQEYSQVSSAWNEATST